MKASSRCALLIPLALAAGSRLAFAQRWACYPIHSGDTAASLAWRLAGHAGHRYQSWFQILDPATSRFIDKARYDDIRPGWLACVSIVPGDPSPVGARTVNPAWYGVLLLPAASLAWYLARRRRRGRRVAIAEMMRFGETFIREFERPLVQPAGTASAIRSRLRCKPYRRRLEVFLAPGAGRHYPNLSDHRENVEYDTARVLQLLGDRSFISDSLRQQGEWVVVPFRLTVDEQQAGVM